MSESGLPPSARHVGLALSLYMNERGGSAFPGAILLGHDTGLHRLTVLKQLRILEEGGWLEVKVRGCAPRGGKRIATEYAASFPMTGSPERPVAEDDRSSTIKRPVTLSDATGRPERLQDVMKAPVKASSVAVQPKQRRNQIDAGFEVTDAMRSWCTEKGIRSNPDSETPKFIDHHRSKGNIFADPVSAWRNWMRNADKYAASAPMATGNRSKSIATVDRVLDQIGAR